jgi:phage shock protein E
VKFCKVLSIIVLFIVASLGTHAFGAEKMVEKTIVIDVRTEAEWKEGHLEGAILIPYETIGVEITKIAPDKQTDIRLYCRSGRRSGIALDTLKKLGYENVSNDGSVKSASETLKIPVVK